MSGLEWLLLAGLMVAAGLGWAAWRRTSLPPVAPPADESLATCQREVAELRAIANSLPVGIIVTNDRTTVRRFNHAAATMLNFDPDPQRVLDRSLIEVVRDYELDAALRSAMLGSDGPARPALDFPYGNRYLRVSACALPVAGSKVAGGLLVLEDVTDIRRIERVRRDFVANVSHEFRTPLATAKLLVETADGTVEDDAEATHRFLDKANQELDAMTHLVSELLDLARIEAGQTPIEPKPLQLVDALANAVERFREPAQAGGLHLRLVGVDERLTVLADEPRLSQVLGNLIQNAIKFTAPDGKITIGARQQGEFAEVSVADTGIGIPKEDLERVFERFYKVDRARSALLDNNKLDNGTGLGLAIARHIVEGQAGRIWAESQPGAGATFHFTMPLADSAVAGAI